MLREILERHQGGRSYLVDKKGRYRPDPINSTFMNALKQDAEITGAINEGMFKHIDKYDEWHRENASQVHELAFGKGFDHGRVASARAHGNEGFLKGILAGWDDAATFKQPHRVYDTTPKPRVPIEKAIKPLAAGVDASALSAALEDTQANRPWKVRTGATATKSGRTLETYKKLTPAAFVLAPERDRLSLNLAAFRGESELINGFDARLTAQDVLRSRVVKRSRESVLRAAMGDSVNIITKPAGIPGRGETALERGKREAEEQSRAAEEAQRKARKPKKITEGVEEPRFEVVETPQVTPQATPQKPRPTPARVSVPAAVELTLSRAPKKEVKSLLYDDNVEESDIRPRSRDDLEAAFDKVDAERKAAKEAAKGSSPSVSPTKKAKVQAKKAKRTVR